jgi:hypothetical protein
MSYVDSTGTWINGETAYTSRTEGVISQRNMAAVPTWFGVSVRDRWNNLSDTLKAQLTPVYEEKADKSLFRLLRLPTDVAGSGWGWTHERLWDDIVGESGWISDTESPLPKHITLDLGATYKFSRFCYWGRWAYDEYWGRQAPRRIEIWGSNNPNPNGSFDESWTLLMTTPRVTKPSGLPSGLTDEDNEAGRAGNESSFPASAPAARYVRLRIIETESMGAEVTIEEITFWGAKVE